MQSRPLNVTVNCLGENETLVGVEAIEAVEEDEFSEDLADENTALDTVETDAAFAEQDEKPAEE